MSQISKKFSPAAPIGTAGASFSTKAYNKDQKFSRAPSARGYLISLLPYDNLSIGNSNYCEASYGQKNEIIVAFFEL